MNSEVFRLIQNYPIKINLYGCRGDIYTLRASGWDIAIQCEYDMQYCDGYVIRICGQHRETKAKLLSSIVRFTLDDLDSYGLSKLDFIEIPLATISNSITIQGEINYSSFKPFTATKPEYVEIQREDFNLTKIPFFSERIAEDEIILPERNIYDLLQEIIAKQEPEMAELRAKRLDLKRKAQRGERISDNLLQLPPATRKVELITIGA